MGTYESHLLALQPLEYVKICVFDRLYTLGSDVLDLLRYRNSNTHARPMEYPVLFTQARTGVAPSTRAYEVRKSPPTIPHPYYPSWRPKHATRTPDRPNRHRCMPSKQEQDEPLTVSDVAQCSP
eukprot:525341-Pyramimonas_sp.AAC.1